MKKNLISKGISVPKFCEVNNFLDLIKFVDENKYPFVLKPISGAATRNTFLIKNEEDLNNFIKIESLKFLPKGMDCILQLDLVK